MMHILKNFHFRPACRLATLSSVLLLCSLLVLGCSAQKSTNTPQAGASSSTVVTTPADTPVPPPPTPPPTDTPVPPPPTPPPTNTPVPPPTPTDTPTPQPQQLPDIAGNYTGSFTTTGHSGNALMDIEIEQSGATLNGMTREAGAVYSDTGTVAADGHFHIIESGNIDLYGSLTGTGHLTGTWGPNGSSGTWDVSLVPTIAGDYQGSFTKVGQSGSSSMQIHIDQIGASLSGTTNESGHLYNDAGTITADGHFRITENDSGGSVDLYGSIAGTGHLTGTWGPNGSSGTWDVSR